MSTLRRTSKAVEAALATALERAALAQGQAADDGARRLLAEVREQFETNGDDSYAALLFVLLPLDRRVLLIELAALRRAQEAATALTETIDARLAEQDPG